MENDNISLLAELIEKYGILKVAVSMMFAGAAIAFPILISWLKDVTKRKEDKKIYNLLITMGDNIKTIANQYSDSMSKQNIEILLEILFKHEFWSIYDYTRDIIEKNDVDNDRSGIEDRIKMQVKISFKTINNELIKFRYKNRLVTDFLACGSWEVEIYNTVIKSVFETKKIPPAKKVSNMKTLLSTEFGNFHFLTMQNINNF